MLPKLMEIKQTEREQIKWWEYYENKDKRIFTNDK